MLCVPRGEHATTVAGGISADWTFLSNTGNGMKNTQHLSYQSALFPFPGDVDPIPSFY